MDGACLARWKLPEFTQRGDVQPIFMRKKRSKFSKHINAAPTTTKKQKQQTNQWGKKSEKNNSFNIKADTQKNLQHQRKTERYFLTPYPSSLKTEYVQSPFCWWAFAGGHTSKAIRLPGVSTHSPRESIEVRMIAFFTRKKRQQLSELPTFRDGQKLKVFFGGFMWLDMC